MEIILALLGTQNTGAIPTAVFNLDYNVIVKESYKASHKQSKQAHKKWKIMLVQLPDNVGWATRIFFKQCQIIQALTQNL